MKVRHFYLLACLIVTADQRKISIKYKTTEPANDCLLPGLGIEFSCPSLHRKDGKWRNGTECVTVCNGDKFAFTCVDGEWVFTGDPHHYPSCLFSRTCKFLHDVTNKAELNSAYENTRIGVWSAPLFGSALKARCRNSHATDEALHRKVCRADGSWSGKRLDCLTEVSLPHVTGCGAMKEITGTNIFVFVGIGCLKVTLIILIWTCRRKCRNRAKAADLTDSDIIDEPADDGSGKSDYYDESGLHTSASGYLIPDHGTSFQNLSYGLWPNNRKSEDCESPENHIYF